MRNAKEIIIVLILSIFFSAYAQEDPLNNITKAIRESDARQLATYFSSSVNLRLSGVDNSYSQSQAEMVMKDFFKKSPAGSFSLTQTGTADNNTRFAIGDYHSGNKTFQVYIQLRIVKDQYQIHQLRFEEKKTISTQ